MTRAQTPQHQMQRLEGRVAWVTGAGSGIGRATAVRLAREGAAIAISTLRPDEGRETAEAVSALGVPVAWTATDVRDAGALTAAHTELVEALGPVDICVNNVGVNQPPVPFLETDDEVFHTIWTTNFMSAVRATRLVLPAMLERGTGSVINLASVQGLLGMVNASAYAASKGAMIAWTRQLAAETSPRGVRVNAVAPGAIMTPMQDSAVAAGGDAYLQRAALLHLIPRLGEPEEVAAAIAFLASDDASFITGTTLPVEGGAMVKPADADREDNTTPR